MTDPKPLPPYTWLWDQIEEMLPATQYQRLHNRFTIQSAHYRKTNEVDTLQAKLDLIRRYPDRYINAAAREQQLVKKLASAQQKLAAFEAEHPT